MFKDIFTGTRLVEYGRVFQPYAAGTWKKILHSDRWQESMHNTPMQQSQGTDSRTNTDRSHLSQFFGA